MKQWIAVLVVSSVAFGLAACAPAVGSDVWCKAMKAKSAGDWTANETADFAKHCIFK